MRSSVVFRIFVTIAAVLLATSVKQYVQAIRPGQSFLLFFFAVAASAWVGGLLYGILATALILAIVGGLTWGTPQAGPDLVVRMAIFAVEAAGVSWLIDTLLRQRVTIESSRTALDSVVETVPNAIVGAERDDTIFLFNRAAEMLTGYRREEVLGRSILELFVPARMREEVSARFANATGTELREPYRIPWRTRSGQEVLIEWRCAPLPGAAGRRILGVGLDVTEIRKLELDREGLLAAESEAREKAEEANRSKDRFLAVLSHELRSPITSVLGWAQLLMINDSDPEMRAQGLKAIEENARAQTRLVDELLDYARLTARRIEIERKPVRISPLVQSVVTSLMPQASEKKLVIKTAIADPEVTVPGDEARLRQVLVNILQNAIRYTDAGCVTVRAERQDAAVRICVTDTGRGISSEFLPHVFDRFVQEKLDAGNGHGKGLGLGLAIVKEVVTLHGGAVEAQSEGPGTGASFTVTLPVEH